MRFTCEKNSLLQGLNIASRTVAVKSSLSLIEGILCKAGMGISLTGYNMETGITYDIDADVVESGSCILPAKLFGDIIRRLPEGPVTVVVDESSYKVSIRSGFASFNISAENAEDYPELPDVNDGRPILIPQNKLKELISGTIFAVADNQARPIHNGVKFEVSDTAVTAVAVDGFRLARRTYHPETPLGREMNFVVPSQGLKEVEKILTDSEENASFLLGAKHILFQVALPPWFAACWKEIYWTGAEWYPRAAPSSWWPTCRTCPPAWSGWASSSPKRTRARCAASFLTRRC